MQIAGGLRGAEPLRALLGAGTVERRVFPARRPCSCQRRPPRGADDRIHLDTAQETDDVGVPAQGGDIDGDRETAIVACQRVLTASGALGQLELRRHPSPSLSASISAA